MLTWRLFANPLVSSNVLYELSNRQPLNVAGFGTLADGGFGDAQVGIADPSDNLIFDCLDHWLGKRIAATDAAGNVAYEGFVAEIEAVRGAARYVRSIDPLANRITVKFTEPDPLHPGATRVSSVVVNNTDSQADYGIKEEQIDISDQGTTGRLQATARANTYLAAHARSRMNYVETAGRDPGLPTRSLLLTCWGYFATLQWRQVNTKYTKLSDIRTVVYNAVTNAAAQFISQTDLTHLDTTGTTLYYNSSGSSRNLQEIITDAIQYGDSAGRRVLFQILEGRTAWLFARGTTARNYTRGIDGRIRDAGGAPIPGYLVRAGGYMLAEELDANLMAVSDVISDDRASFIEATHWNDIEEKLTLNPSDDLPIELLVGRLWRGKRRVKV